MALGSVVNVKIQLHGRFICGYRRWPLTGCIFFTINVAEDSINVNFYVLIDQRSIPLGNLWKKDSACLWKDVLLIWIALGQEFPLWLNTMFQLHNSSKSPFFGQI